MASGRKRSLQEATSPIHNEPLLVRVRNMWQFANLCQWIFLFGKVVKIDENLDTDEIESECLKPGSPVLKDIGLALLKMVSSQRGLTLDNFSEYTRRQYMAKKPSKNPFGAEEAPVDFSLLEIFTKIRVLHQLTQWIMLRPERVREKMDESKDTDQTSWRIEPIGWDRDDRTYFVLDDNRVYRLTEPEVEPLQPRKKVKSSRRGQRASKRRKISHPDSILHGAGSDAEPTEQAHQREDDDLGGMKWECVAVTLDEVRSLTAPLQKTKDENERILCEQLQEHLLPILEKQESSRKRRELQRDKELENLAKMANAKRSSRIAGRQERLKLEADVRDEEQRRRVAEAAAKKSHEKQMKLEKDRDSRLLSRDNRLKEREARRSQYEDELSNLSEDSRRTDGDGRASQRKLTALIETNKQALKDLEREEAEDDWMFDCVCGVFGQIDDGTHSISCEECNVWQHSKCVGIRALDAEHPEFHFICDACRRRKVSETSNARPTIKLKVNRPATATASLPSNTTSYSKIGVEIPSQSQSPRGRTQPDQRDQESSTAVSIQKGTKDGSQATQHDSAAHPNYQHTELSGSSVQSSNSLSSFDRPSTDPRQTSIRNARPEKSPGAQRKQATPLTPRPIQGKLGPGTSIDPVPSQTSIPRNATAEDSSRSGPSSTPVASSGIVQSPGVHGTMRLQETPVFDQHSRRTSHATSAGILPSSSSGQSPTKQSPAVAKSQQFPLRANATLPAVFPPTTMLAPSPQQPILTPPTKHASNPRQPEFTPDIRPSK